MANIINIKKGTNTNTNNISPVLARHSYPIADTYAQINNIASAVIKIGVRNNIDCPIISQNIRNSNPAPIIILIASANEINIPMGRESSA